MKSPTVTVIVVTRDRPALLADALASIAAQKRAPLEVRIADDGEIRAILRTDVSRENIALINADAHSQRQAAFRFPRVV